MTGKWQNPAEICCILCCNEVGEGAAEVVKKALVPHGDADSGGAPLPHPHEPDVSESPSPDTGRQ